VGSNNSLLPWTGNTTATPEQTAEVLGRTAADIELIHETFASARARHNRAVVLMTQADIFDLTMPVDKLERITVDGSDNNHDYLRVTIHPRGKEVLSWTRVPYTS
jgi:hypothetical protein